MIDYDVRVAEGNDKAAFVFGARDADNYVSAELDLNGSGDARFILRHTTDGKTTQDASESLASIIPASDKHKAHHIRLKVTTAQYALEIFRGYRDRWKDLGEFLFDSRGERTEEPW